MAERKFRQHILKKGDAARIRDEVAQEMRESIFLQRPKAVDPVDYETYITKNKTILHNDPQREMLTFPYDDIVIPPPAPPKTMRTVYSTVPQTAAQEATNLLVRECIKSYTDTCHLVKYKYEQYSGGYQKLLKCKTPEVLPEHIFEIDAESEEKAKDEDTISRSMTAVITKEGWLYKGPDSGRENVISFTRQFKRRYFVLKQQADMTYILEFFKDEKKMEAKGSIFLELATDAVKNPKKGKYSFEIKMSAGRPYLLSADNESEAADWIHTINKVINLAETGSQISLDQPKEELNTPDKAARIENSMHPELQKYSRETESMANSARTKDRQNLFKVYPNLNNKKSKDQRMNLNDDTDSEEETEVDVFPREFGERFLLGLLEFKMKLQINLADEGLGNSKSCNPEPFFLTFSLYDAKEGRKISEDFRIDPNEPEILGMIPNDVLYAADKLQSVEGKKTSPILNGLDEKWLLSKKKQGIFSVVSCHSEVYVVVTIEKVLQGPSGPAIETYLKALEGKNGSKQLKQMKQFCSSIGHYRMPFAWSACQVISPELTPRVLPLYRYDGNKIAEEDLIKHLQDFRKPEKQSKLQEIPGTLKITLKKLASDEILQSTLTSSFVPIKPFPDPPVEPPAFEIDEFVPEKASLCDTFDSYINTLYVYPCNLKFEHQKSFAKARNIACCIELRESDSDNAVSLKCLYGRPEIGLFTSVASTTVIHHSTSPDFAEEVKIALPIQIHDRHHILFRFYHVSCEGSKSSIKKRDNIENAVGVTWLPLLHQGKVVNGEVTIPVAANLPPGYLSHRMLEPGRGSMSEMKWVDGAKPIFKVKLNVRSTVYTTDPHLHNFFWHCQKLENSANGADVELVNKLKSVHAVDCCVYVKFLPTLLNQLFSLLSKSLGEDISLNTVKVLIHIVSELHDADKADSLRNYVKYVFKPDPIPKGTKQKTVHEELATYLTMILRPATGDHVITSKILKHSWFFFQILIKSMTLYLIDADRVKMPRNERFTSDFQYKIQSLIPAVASYIIQKHKDMARETKNANQSVAYFLKMCFTLLDRGFVFQMIAKYMENFGPGDDKTLFEFKYDFLTKVCEHEHYIPLSLPLMRKGMIKTFKDIKMEDLKCDYTLSDEYRQNHYLAGLLLHELKMALNEPRDIRRIAIIMLRNQLAKHAFDDRYTSKSQQGRIAALYLPIISVLMEHKRHLVDDPAKPKAVPKQQPTKPVANGDVKIRQSSQPSTPQTVHKTVTFDTPVRDSKVFAIIAGQTGTPTLSLPDSSHLNGSTGSLASSGTSSDKETSTKEKKHKRSPSSSNVSSSGAQSKTLMYKIQKLDIMEIKDLLLCFISVIKHLPEDIILGWFNNSSEYDIIDFFGILETCLHHFKYQGRKKIHDLSIIGDSRKALTMPASRRSMPSVQMGMGMSPRTYSQYSDLNSDSIVMPESRGQSSSEADAVLKALQEANMSTEVGLVVLDILSLYCSFFQKNLEHKDGDNSLMQRVFSLYLYFLQHSQSETLQKHIFAALRQFIRKFDSVLYRGNAKLCGDLCYEILGSCNSKLYSTRKEACALLYLLMRQNFEYTKKKSVTRVHLQVIISVNKLIGNVVGLSNSHLQESLAMINSYASSDRMMQTFGPFTQFMSSVSKNRSEMEGKSKKRKGKSEKSGFPAEVKDLTKKIRTVLMATAQMKEHENDKEMLIDLQYSLAKSYDSTPELRKTWLDSMALIHNKHGDFSEEAHCYIHVAALVAEYLKRRGCFPQGCSAFKPISPNIEKEECGIKDDSGMQDVQYTEETMVEYLEKAARASELAERYELLGEIYKLVTPVYEFSRDYDRLAACYSSLSQAYTKASEVIRSGKRLLGKYFRVAFYGTYFEDEDGKEYIYKEPKVTSLPEICERLTNIYGDKYGREIIKILHDSKKVNQEKLDSRYGFIQVTHVTPYFDERELQKRLTDYERNNIIKRFMHETPFTKDGKTHGDIDKQCKRRTVSTTVHSFPFVKKRIEVCERKEYELSPIEVAIDSMQTKVAEMREVVNLSHPDLKKLQLKLQGSVSAQVNAGPLAYAEAFLNKDNVSKFPETKVELLKEVFRDFVYVCNDALDLNATLVTTEQKEYHESLNSGFQDIVSRLSEMFGEKISLSEGGTLSRRGSQAVLNINTSSAGASSVA